MRRKGRDCGHFERLKRGLVIRHFIRHYCLARAEARLDATLAD